MLIKGGKIVGVGAGVVFGGHYLFDRDNRYVRTIWNSGVTMVDYGYTFKLGYWKRKYERGDGILRSVGLLGSSTSSDDKNPNIRNNAEKEEEEVKGKETTMTSDDYRAWKLTDEYKELQKEFNIRVAQRLFTTCKLNGGLYTKLGQYISTLNHALPAELISIMQPLTDKAKPMPKEMALEAVRFEFRELLNQPDLNMSDVFSEFDEEPIAAASLAQVHRARIAKTGEEVAVKIQYPYLKDQVNKDFWMMEMLAGLLKEFYGLDYSWLIQEFRTNSKHELNFLQEARNSERLRKMVEKQKYEDVYVPKIFHELTNSHVLTMEFIHGVRVDNMNGIKDLNLIPHDIAQTVCHVFADMYFVWGFVHADPHPGNLLVRPRPSNPKKHQLVVLDHGMYRRLDPDFRRLYCNLWKSLLTRNYGLGLETTRKLGVPDFGFDILSLILTFRMPQSESMKTGGRMTKEDRKKLREKFKDVSLNDVNEFTKKLPRDILFVMRSTAIMRSVNLTLGGTSRERFNIMGEAAVRGLRLNDARNSSISSSKDESNNKSFADGFIYNIDDPVDVETFDVNKSNAYDELFTEFEIWKVFANLWLIDNIWARFEDISRIYRRWFTSSFTGNILKEEDGGYLNHGKDLG